MAPAGSTSVAVRFDLVEALQLDLVGPSNDHAFARELLPEPPTRWYLTGVLAPVGARMDEPDQGDEQLDVGGDLPGADDAAAPEKGAAKKSIMPSSMGVSVLVTGATRELEATIEWGDYAFEGEGEEEPEAAASPNAPSEGEQSEASKPTPDLTKARKRAWRRTPKTVPLVLSLPTPGGDVSWVKVPDSNGLEIMVISRHAPTTGGLPAGTLSISVFLVNKRREPEKGRYKACIFQAHLGLACLAEGGFVGRTDLRGSEGTLDRDDAVACVHFRDVFEYAVGHGVSATTDIGPDGRRRVLTTWLPQAEVERVAPRPIEGVALGMEDLGRLTDGAEATSKLEPLVSQYRDWLKGQAAAVQGLSAVNKPTGEQMLRDAELAARRIEAGIALLADPIVMESFRIANRTMAAAARQRVSIEKKVEPATLKQPEWRPFQLAFILMALRGIVEPNHPDRGCVDLLFFPTGGGKTEAYLGLAAFTMVYRRLRPGSVSLIGRDSTFKAPGMSVLMRYTLRLLTLDQLSRAAALICALEGERQANRGALGDWPFEIGLWVGKAATPNRMGDSKSQDPQTARKKTLAFQQNPSNPSPIPLEECPWCGTKFASSSFRLSPNQQAPTDLHIYCVNRKCQFASRSLPIVAVDEPLYRRLPSFIIATVDKFAALPWTGQVGKLFGHASRFDSQGFYGDSDGMVRSAIAIPGASGTGGLPPPDLIIQDELHLISGPLGTIAGLYETALDALASRGGGDSGEPLLLPKIVASTATVRRAEAQIRALFGRQAVAIFPPPGPDRRDSFFAKTLTSDESPARLYVGVAAQGRSLKVVLLRTARALLSAGQTAYSSAGGTATAANPADPYMTMLGYFNSLRELGGSRRIIEDEVYNQLKDYGQRRKRLDPADGLFSDRDLNPDLLELTSRVSTSKVADAKRKLACDFNSKDAVDVALATNMISVGLDIVRLGLMVVLGQPKTTAEYIQATSRVGRQESRPGLVVTLLNIHKPRDRSHYERFESYHTSFYRSVEATSVTPFSPRALDRALPAALVGLCRHGEPGLTAAAGAGAIVAHRTALDRFALLFARRAENHKDFDDPSQGRDLFNHVVSLCQSLLDAWRRTADETRAGGGGGLIYQPWEETRTGTKLLHEILDPALADLPEHRQRFRANRSMRDVEPTADLYVESLHRAAPRMSQPDGGGAA